MSSGLELLNLTEDEKKVYLQIVAFSQLSIEEIANYTGLNFESLDKIINELINKKYVKKIESLNRYVCKFPFLETAREFSEIIKDLKLLNENLSRFIDEQKVKIQQEEEERKQKVNDEVSTKIKEANDINNQFSEKYVSIHDSMTNTIKNDNENLSKSLKESLNSIKNEFNTSQENLTTNWTEKFNIYQEKSTQILVNLGEEINKHASTFDSELTNAISSYFNTIKENISQFSSDSTISVDQTLNEGQISIDQTQSQLNESLTSFYTNYRNLIDELNSKFSEIVNTNSLSTEEFLSAKNNEIKEKLKTDISLVLEKINSHIEEIKVQSESTFSEQVNKQTEVKNGFLNELEQNLSQYEETLTNSKNITVEKINQQTSEFLEQNQLLSTNFKNLNQNYLELTTETIKAASSNAETLIRENFSSIEDSITSLFQEFSSRLSSLETSAKEKSKSLEFQLNTNFENLIENWHESLQDFSKQTDNSLLTYDNNTYESLLNFSSILQKQIDDWSIEQKEKILYLLTSKDEKKKKYDEIEKESVNNYLQTITEIQTNTLSEIKNQIESLQQSLETIEEERIKSIMEENKSSFTKFTDQITAVITNLGEIAKEQENDNRENIDSALTTVKSNFVSMGDKIKSDIITTTDTHSGIISTSKSEMVTNKDNFLSKNQESIRTAINNGLNEHKETFDSFNSAFLENHNFIKTELTTLLNNIEEQSINQIGSTITNVLSKMQELSIIQEEITTNNLTTIKKIEEISSHLISFMSDQYKAIEENFNQSSQELASSIKKSENTLNIRSTTLQNLENLVSDFKYPVLNSAPIFGLDGVHFHIENMFKKLKSKMTLFIPNPEFLPEKQILSAKTSQQITVISSFDLDRHKEMLKKFADRDNIQIRALEPSAEIPPFIGCDKDAEESLFGSYEGNEFVGMQTTQSPFIELIGKRVIASFLPLAKKISRNDLN